MSVERELRVGDLVIVADLVTGFHGQGTILEVAKDSVVISPVLEPHRRVRAQFAYITQAYQGKSER